MHPSHRAGLKISDISCWPEELCVTKVANETQQLPKKLRRALASSRQASAEGAQDAEQAERQAQEAAAQLLQDEQAAAESAQHAKARSASKKARQKQRKQVGPVPVLHLNKHALLCNLSVVSHISGCQLPGRMLTGRAIGTAGGRSADM